MKIQPLHIGFDGLKNLSKTFSLEAARARAS